MRVSTLQGAKMSMIGDWLLAQPPYVGLPLTLGLSVLVGYVVGLGAIFGAEKMQGR